MKKDAVKKILRDALPPAALRALRALQHPKQFGFFGNFASWEEAKKRSSGYDDTAILSKVKDAALKVKRGEAAFERDSVAFEKPEYSWPLLASLLSVASREGGRLGILDFGGSLGSTYFQHRALLSHLSTLSWGVVEQPHFVETGQKEFADKTLAFFPNIAECVRAKKPNVALFSSVLQYMEKPYDILAEIMETGIPYLLFDRTAFLQNEAPDRITVQTVPPKIYSASYPAWFFNQEKFLGALENRYQLLAEWDALAGAMDAGGTPATDKGFIFKKI